MIIEEKNHLAHYGILRRSGRYPWGSGGDVATRSRSFFDHISELRKTGMSDTDIARGFGMTTTEFRDVTSIAKNAKRASDVGQAQRLKDKGYSNIKIGERMGIPESSVRALLAPGVEDRLKVLHETANMLKGEVAKKKYLDVGTGVELHVGVSRTKLNAAITVLKDQGYQVHKFKRPQVGTGLMTEYKVLVAPGVTQKEAWTNYAQVRQITEHSEDGGRTFLGIKPPTSIDSKRVAIRYAEEGGDKADGVILVRRGVDDVSLGASRYAQVRIAVDDTHYLKGMAMYGDDLPKGVDLVFNTNKSNTGNKFDAMKKLKDDPDNPFGAVINRQKGVMNIINEEGTWDTWSRTLSSQMLSKQSPTLAKQQLDMLYESRKNEFDEIMALTHPAVRRRLLKSLADGADSSAVHLEAAQLPRQANHVILPISSMKENEIYAPKYNNGDRVVLVRHPHGGIFEIPELVVNNRNAEAKRLLGTDAADAVGIHHKVAQKLSGADFDGDTVLVIPNNHGKVQTKPTLRDLKDFDPQKSYAPYDGMKTIDGGTYNAKTRSVDYGGKKPSTRTKQIQMGDVSNLITDMTIKAASDQEIARAVKHSMVIIDAEKHSLDYKRSALDNGISSLKKKYQGSARSGASTLISRASSEKRVPERTPRRASKGGPIDKTTGKLVFEPTGATYVNKRGKVVPRTTESTKLAETHDAHTLSSNTKIEQVYADHSNKLKALANQARLEMVHTKSAPYSPSAKLAYKSEVDSLSAKLNIALRNKPLERQAQLLANATVEMKRQANPNMEKEELAKIRRQALDEARTRTGAKPTRERRIPITKAEWDAIQAGAITSHKLSQILDHTDLDLIKQFATPKTKLLMTGTKVRRAQSMLSLGYTQAEVASALGVSVTTLKNSLAG